MSLEPAPAAPAAAPAQGDPPPTPLGRAGLGLCAVAALLLAATANGHVAEQDLRSVSLSGSVIAWGVVLAVLLALAAIAPWMWARLAGVTLGAVVAGIAGAVVVGARSDDVFLTATDVSLGRSGFLLVACFAVAVVGVVLALVGLRRPEPDGAADAGALAVREGTSGKAVAALVMGLVGLIVAPVGALAIGFAILARDEIRRAGGRLSGNGMAIAGLVLGILDLAGWGLGLAIGMGSVNP